MTLSKSELRAFQEFEQSGWETAADPYHQHWGFLSSQSADPMLDAAEVTRGSKVLDVATGAGYVAASAVQRGARAVGIDFSAAQIDLARQTFPEVEFRKASAEALPFSPDTFDAVVMGFGMNHMPDPEAAFGEACRVLKPGGRFAFTVWSQPNPGEGFGIVLSAIETHSAAYASLPPAPPYFRFANPDETAAVFTQAGFVEPATVTVPQYWRHTSPDQVFDAFNEGAVRATAMLRAQPADARHAIRSEVKSEVTKLRQGDYYVIPVPAALSSATKP
ncbi:methyltransferase domain-containing protein [Anderseniella sp. Alg231-50]|uniref:methyltransferase domain-containing protein n=1 Tax=Anderseniella sp. Alg231-50 TaxID=1922226 RepID=UPI000D558F5A